ncbi:MAG: hypothetical protein ACK5MJ_00245 [Alphaproteobacteria bacterium]
MRLIAFIMATMMFAFSASAQPVGKWANLKRYPNCDVFMQFNADGSALVPNSNASGKTMQATWRLQGSTLIIKDRQNDWESYYDYKGNKIIWKSVKALGKTQNITNQFSLDDRILNQCK